MSGISEATIEAYYESLRPFWHSVMPVAQLAGQPIAAAELLGQPVVVTRLNGELVAMADVCRHFQAQLSLGEIRQIAGHGECLMCPYHGWSYAATGQCVAIPQLEPDRVIPESARVDRYLVQEKYGLIWVCLAETARYPLPHLPDLDNAAFLPGPLRCYPAWTASAPRVIMAALDDTHGAWVHEGLVGERDHPEPPDHTVRREGSHLIVNFTMLQPDNPTIAEEQANEALREVTITTTVGIPNTIHFNIRALDSQHVTLIWQAVCPVRHNQTLTFWGSARNYDLDQPAHNAAFEQLQDTLREQDRRVVESQRPWLLPPFWTKTELPTRPADLPLVEYQKWLEELGIVIQI